MSPPHFDKRRNTLNVTNDAKANQNLKRAVLAMHKNQSVIIPENSQKNSKFAIMSANGDSKTEEKEAERCIRGIPVRTFIDEVKR